MKYLTYEELIKMILGYPFVDIIMNLVSIPKKLRKKGESKDGLDEGDISPNGEKEILEPMTLHILKEDDKKTTLVVSPKITESLILGVPCSKNP